MEHRHWGVAILRSLLVFDTTAILFVVVAEITIPALRLFSESRSMPPPFFQAEAS